MLINLVLYIDTIHFYINIVGNDINITKSYFSIFLKKQEKT